MLSGYIKEFGSDEQGVEKALTAYNWGLTNVRNAIASAAADNEIARLHAAETGQVFVQKTWRNYITTDQARDYAPAIYQIRQGSWFIPGYFGTSR